MAQSGPDKPVVSIERERERTIELLSQHFAHDNITLDELERRIELVYRATSVASLRDLVRDLPTAADAASEKKAIGVPEPYTLAHDRIVAVMSETKRRGLWYPPKQLDVWCVMSDTQLDLTEAQLGQGVTEIHLRTLMASVKVIVPPGVRIVVQPSAIMSSVNFAEDAYAQPKVGSGAPVVRITGRLIMTELKVAVRALETI